MIYTQHGEPVEVVSGRCHDLVNPATLDAPAYTVRSLNDPNWSAVRTMSQLRADGGAGEIETAFKAADEKYGKVATSDEEERNGGVKCKCGKFTPFSAYVFAHWRERISFTCPKCGKRYSVLAGVPGRPMPRK